MILSETQNKISRCSLVVRVTRDVQVMSHTPWEFRDSSLLKKSHSLLLVSEVLLHPNVCITSLWKTHKVKGSSKPSESESQERMHPSLMLFPHSMPHPSLGVCAQLQPSSPAFLCKAVHRLSLSFLADFLVLSFEDVCYICSLEAAHKELQKRKKKKPIHLCGHWSQGFALHWHRSETEPSFSIHTAWNVPVYLMYSPNPHPSE